MDLLQAQIKIAALLEAGQALVESHGHELYCSVLNRPEWACQCGCADRIGEARAKWRKAVEGN